MSKKDNMIFEEITRETRSLRESILSGILSLQEIDLEELVDELKEICQSLLSKRFKKPKLELNNGRFPSSVSDRDVQMKDSPSNYEIHQHNITMQDRSIETLNSNDIHEMEVSDEEDGSFTYDSSDDASLQSEDNDMLGNSDILREITNMIYKVQFLSLIENAAADNLCSNISTDKKVMKKDLESAGLRTWDLFKENNCTGDLELVTQCRTHCLKLEKNLLLVEGNLRTLENVRKLIYQLRQIHSDNFMVLGGTNALQRVEERSRECNKIICHHKKMRYVLVKIRKTFPLSEEAIDQNAEDLLDAEDSKNNSIEKRPVPNFWN